MKSATMRTGESRRNLAPTVMALTVAAIIGAAWMAPVQAEERGRGHEVSRAHHGRDWHRGGYAAPAYVYAPPPVYYAPPEAPPAIDFVFPLHFR